MSKMINITINDKPVSVADGSTILEAAKTQGIKIPTLCHFKMDCFHVEHRVGSCRVCVVEVEGRPNLAPACCTPVLEGMKIKTNSIRAINARRTILDLILSNHPKECLTCEKNLNCELQRLAEEFGLHKVKYEGEIAVHPKDIANESIARDMSKCIMCRRCETACNIVQTVGVLSGVDRGFHAIVAPTQQKPLAKTKCVFCGQCVNACPVGALTEISRTYDVWRAINDPSKTVVVQTAPAVRVAIGEEFGLPAGTVPTGKMVSALKFLGFDKVFDTDFSADLTIIEEGAELVNRVLKQDNLPILTSCCPGWVKFFEHQFPDLLNVPSTAKSPQQMFGAIAKSYYAEKIGVNPENLIVVSVMPCLAKKYEASRPEFVRDGVRDVDIVISTRELANMIREAGVQFNDLENSEYDSPLGESTGAAVIFGATGGVLEAALRTVNDWLTVKGAVPIDSSVFVDCVGDKTAQTTIDFTPVRGLEGVREATVDVGPLKGVKVAIACGLGNARKLLESVRESKDQGKAPEYVAIEIMACPGGCINGGGQPYHHGNAQIIEKRFSAIYEADKAMTVRKSHENKDLAKLYTEFLKEPNSHKAHELLHTHYTKRENK